MRWASNIALITAVFFAVIVVGGVHTSVAGITAGLALVAFGLQVVHLYRRKHRSVYVSSVGVGALLAALVCFLQLIPVPELLQQLLSPRGWEIVSSGFEAARLDLAAGWRPLSMEPAATADRALRFTALGLVSLAGANVYARHGWRPASRVVIALGIGATVIGGVMWLVNAHSFLGFFPTEVGFRAPGPFVNTNHGAVLFGFAAIVAASLAVDVRQKRRWEAMFAAACAVAFLGNCLFHNSEGTNLALVGTVVVAAVVLWFRAGRPTNVPRPTLVAVSAIGVMTLVMFFWLDVDRLALDYFDRVVFGGEHGNRLELVGAGLSAAADYWPFGAGIGATETVIPAYIDWSEMIPASIPVLENDTAELLMGAGLVLGPAILLCFLITPLSRLRPAADPTRSNRFVVAALVAFFGIAIAQMHFPLFTLGIGVPMVAFLEVAWSRRMRSTGDGHVFRSGHLAVPLAGAGLLAALLAAGLAIAAHAHFRGYDVQMAPRPTRAEAARMLRLRPADHRTYVRLAVAAARNDEPERATELARLAMAREPSPRVRLFLARAFALHDPQKSLEEYRQLFREVAPVSVYLESMLGDVRDSDLRAELVSAHPERWWVIANEIRRREGADSASSFAVALVGAHPGHVEAYRVATRLYMRLGQTTLARLWAELLSRLEADLPPDERTAAVFLAKALAAEGRRPEAWEALSESARRGAADEVHRYALALRGDVRKAKSPHVENVRVHYDKLCRSPIAEENLRICWQAQAWLAEADGDFAEARRTLDRISRRFDQPVPLVTFFQRHGRCRRIEAQLAQLEPGTASYDRVKAILRNCTPAFE